MDPLSSRSGTDPGFDDIHEPGDTEDGVAGALQMFEKQSKGYVILENLTENEEKLAKNIINFIGANAQGVKNEAE